MMNSYHLNICNYHHPSLTPHIFKSSEDMIVLTLQSEHLNTTKKCRKEKDYLIAFEIFVSSNAENERFENVLNHKMTCKRYEHHYSICTILLMLVIPSFSFKRARHWRLLNKSIWSINISLEHHPKNRKILPPSRAV